MGGVVRTDSMGSTNAVEGFNLLDFIDAFLVSRKGFGNLMGSGGNAALTQRAAIFP